MVILFNSEKEIIQLAAGFTNQTLDKNKWTHEAHLTVAIWHLRNYDLLEATCLLRSGIISYNLSTGSKNTGSEGYHETLTLFWVSIIDFYVTRQISKTLLETCNNFLNSTLADKALPFYFYEKQNILSAKARAYFIPSDKTPVNNETLEILLKKKQP